MADGVCLLHQLRRLAEISFFARGIDHCACFTLADDGTGKHGIAGFSLGGQRLSCQRGLIHFHRVAVQQSRIRRHNVAQAHADDIAWHQLAGRWVDPLPIPFYPGLDGQFGFQGGDGVARLAFLPEADDGVGHQQ